MADEDMTAYLDEDMTAYLDEMLALRAELRERIAELSAARNCYLMQHGAGPEARRSESFDEVVRRTIRERAEQFGYSFPDR